MDLNGALEIKTNPTHVSVSARGGNATRKTATIATLASGGNLLAEFYNLFLITYAFLNWKANGFEHFHDRYGSYSPTYVEASFIHSMKINRIWHIFENKKFLTFPVIQIWREERILKTKGFSKHDSAKPYIVNEAKLL